MALTENHFEEAVNTIVNACQEDENFKTHMMAAISGNQDNMELTDSDLEAISGGGFGSWIKNKVVSIYRSYQTVRRYY